MKCGGCATYRSLFYVLFTFTFLTLQPCCEEKKADCVSLIVFLLCVTVCVLCHFLAVPCIGLRSVIVTFPSKTYALRIPF